MDEGLWQRWDVCILFKVGDLSKGRATSPVRKESQGPPSGPASWDEGLADTGAWALKVHPILGPVPCGFRLPLLQIPTDSYTPSSLSGSLPCSFACPDSGMGRLSSVGEGD